MFEQKTNFKFISCGYLGTDFQLDCAELNARAACELLAEFSK